MSDIVAQITAKLLHGAGDTEVRHVLWDARQEIQRLRGEGRRIEGFVIAEDVRKEAKRLWMDIQLHPKPDIIEEVGHIATPATLILHTGAADG